MSRRLRQLRMGLATLFGIKRQGFFIPYRYADRLPSRTGRDAYPAVAAMLATARPACEQTLADIDGLAAELERIGGQPPEPRWAQDWFPRLDAAAAYTMVRRHRPGRIVEVGSGHSTRFLARAVRDGDLATRIAAIDPAPRADLAGLGVEILRTTVQEADPAIFAGLVAGDILMIDSSHILMPGSDVDLLLSTVLPRLPAGVLLHVHDIFLPDDYPADWGWRGYNEQQGVAALLAGGGWEILFASHYAVTRMADRLAAGVVGRLPLPAGAFESGLWLRRRSNRQP